MEPYTTSTTTRSDTDLDHLIDPREALKDDTSEFMIHRIIVWFRNDLRVHDNYLLRAASDTVLRSKLKNKGETDRLVRTEVLPVFCFDPRFYNTVSPYNSRKCGFNRTRFMLESVANLRENLRKVGSDLLVAHGNVEDVIPQFVPKYQKATEPGEPRVVTSLIYQEEVCYEELQQENILRKRLKKDKVNVQTRWGSTIYHYEDLTTPPEESAHIYGNFVRKSEGSKIRKCVPAPKDGELPFPAKESLCEEAKVARDYMPSYEEFGFKASEHIERDLERASLDFLGGEDEGMKRLNHYLWKYQGMKDYKDRRNGFFGPDFSSKFSPWMANGCLSPREIYWQVKKWESDNEPNRHSEHFIAELFWRDFWHYWAYKHGDEIFYEYGHAGRQPTQWRVDKDTIARWKAGTTGMPIIDAIQRDLLATGYISNRARQMTASYLCLDLKQDWRHGAFHFEETLIDHDVHSNSGGWNAAGGMGPGKVLHFNQIKQSMDHDKLGLYIKTWCPELQKVPTENIHEPWKMSKEAQEACGVIIGKDYPKPIPCQKYVGGAGQAQNLGFVDQKSHGGGQGKNKKSKGGKKNNF